MKNQKGKFIVIDGTDGSGKSTMTKELVSYLKSKGINVHHTREPGGTPFAESIRNLLLSSVRNFDEKIDPDTELLLMFASRNQHLKTKIIPALEKGDWVVCERWTSSTFAYQGVARNLGTEKIMEMDKKFVSMKPDMSIIFDLDTEISKERMGIRPELDHIEQEGKEFFEKVRKGYQLYADSCLEPAFIINASEDINNVKNKMLKIVLDNSGLKKSHNLSSELQF